VAEIEGEDDSEDKLGDAFITLLVDIKEDEVVEEHSDLYFTLVEHLLTEPTIAYAGSPYVEVLIKELNN
jgi:tRNA nucleotidyltransferase (CCA-adding enzyme)